MILQQLRYLREIVDQGYNVSRAAQALYTSQPGVSKQIRQLEDELGTEIFVRERGRIVGLTEPGRAIVEQARAALRATENIGAVARDHLDEEVGALRIAATFTVAKYILPAVLVDFVARYPRVRLTLLEGDPASACGMVSAGEADIAVTTRPARRFAELLMMECSSEPPVLIAPRGHPLLRRAAPSLAEIARYRLVAFNAGSEGQLQLHRELERAGCTVDPVFASPMNADVMKRMVEAGLGIAVLSKSAYDPARDAALGAVGLGHLLPPRSVCLSVRSDLHHRGYLVGFVRLLAPGIDRRAMAQAVAGVLPA